MFQIAKIYTPEKFKSKLLYYCNLKIGGSELNSHVHHSVQGGWPPTAFFQNFKSHPKRLPPQPFKK